MRPCDFPGWTSGRSSSGGDSTGASSGTSDCSVDFFARSSAAFRSVFRLSIHHNAPVASQASFRTEWTIWPVSRPRVLMEFSRSRSSGVEKIKGAGVFSREEKS